MKFLCLLLIAYCFSATVVGSSKTGGGYKEAILSCNSYIDSIIQEVLEEHGDYFDPYPINESLVKFHKKIAFVDFKGEAKITEGYISGLSNLHRASSCALSFEQGRLKVSSKLEVDELTFNFTGSMEAVKIHKQISAKGDTSKVLLNVVISLDADGKNSILENLNVVIVSKINVGVQGTRFLGWMEDAMKKSVVEFFERLTEKLVDSQIKKLWVERMKENPFSLEQFDLDISDFDTTTSTTTEDNTHIGKPVYTVEESNSYIDSILENRFLFEAAYSKLERYYLPDDRIEKVYISSEEDNYLDLKDGAIEYLTNLKRIQDCTQPLKKSSNISFNCFLGFHEPLMIHYSAESHNGNAISNFDLIALVDDTRLGVRITTTVKDNVPSMVSFNIHNLGSVTVKVAHVIAGSQPMQAESTFDKNVLIKYFSEKIQSLLLGKLRDVLGYSIYKTPIHFLE